MPTSSFDTFFACTIIVAAALIGMAFFGSTMQTRIASTQDIDKDSYLKAIADRIVTNTGSPVDWGTSSGLPVNFGLAPARSHGDYELDLDKICRLNNLNNYSLSYLDLSKAANLDMALGIKLSQLMTVKIIQSSNSTIGTDTSFTFQISANIDSKPTSASLHCYFAADTYLTEINGSIPDIGFGQVTIQIPTSETKNAMLVAFARASIDDRVTSYAIYNFAHSTQESIPSSTDLALSPLDYTLSLNNTSLRVLTGYVFAYSYQHNLSSFEGSQVAIPKLLDKSPLVLFVKGTNGTNHFQEWTVYPQIPLKIGANFDSSEQNIFSYMVTVEGVLYRLDLSLGDLPR